MFFKILYFIGSDIFSFSKIQENLVHVHIGSNSELIVVAVQLLSHVQLFATPRTAARQASLSFTISLSLLKLMSIESVMPSNHFILCRPLLLLPSASGSFPMSRLFTSGGQSIECELTVRANLVFFHQSFYFEEMFL